MYKNTHILAKLYSISAVCFITSLILLVFSINSTDAIGLQDEIRRAEVKRLASDTLKDKNFIKVQFKGKEYIYLLN